MWLTQKKKNTCVSGYPRKKNWVGRSENLFFFTYSVWHLDFNVTSFSYPIILTVVSFSGQILNNKGMIESDPSK